MNPLQKGIIVNQKFGNVRMLSRIAYTVWFGTLWGYATFQHENSDPAFISGLFYVWIISGFIGAILVVLKNSSISDHMLRLKFALTDLFVTLILFVLIYTIPNFIGLVKSAIILAVAVIYTFFYDRSLDKAEL